MGRMNQPNLGRLTGVPKGALLSTQEALSKKKEIDDVSKYDIQYIPVSQLEPIPFNREVYSVEDFDFLSATIKQYGILQPLIVQEQPEGDKYWIIAGERRYRSFLASREDEGAPKLYSAGLPCRVFPSTMSVTEIRILVIIANATARPRTQDAQVKELRALIELFKASEEEGLDIGYSLKEMAMSKLKISERQYQKYIASFKVIPELDALLSESSADLNLAAAIGAKPLEVQQEILSRVQSGEVVRNAYDDVNKQYLDFKQETKSYDQKISELKEELASQPDDAVDTEVRETQIKQEIEEQKQKKKEHQKTLSSAVKKQKTNSVRSEAQENNIPTSSQKIDSFQISVDDAFVYADQSLRALFIHAKEFGSSELEQLRALKQQLDLTIQTAEQGEEFSL